MFCFSCQTSFNIDTCDTLSPRSKYLNNLITFHSFLIQIVTNLQCYRSAQRTIEYKIKNHFFSGAHIEFEEDFEEFGNIEQEMGKVIYSCLIRAYVQFPLRIKLLSFFLLYFPLDKMEQSIAYKRISTADILFSRNDTSLATFFRILLAFCFEKLKNFFVISSFVSQ